MSKLLKSSFILAVLTACLLLTDILNNEKYEAETLVTLNLTELETVSVKELTSSEEFLKELSTRNPDFFLTMVIKSPLRALYFFPPSPDNKAEFLSQHISVQTILESNEATINTTAYYEGIPLSLAEDAVALMNEHLNTVSLTSYNTNLSASEANLEVRRAAMELAKSKLDGFEMAHEIVIENPSKNGHVLALMTIQAKIKNKQAQLKTLLSRKHPASHEVILTKREIYSLEQSANAIGKSTYFDKRIKNLMVRHEGLILDYNTSRTEHSAAKKEYEALLTSPPTFLNRVSIVKSRVITQTN